ncbi:hypothetical protein HF998_10490 [Cellulomonas hominis]|nr:hypothetical protein [Cellulomonas hominis]
MARSTRAQSADSSTTLLVGQWCSSPASISSATARASSTVTHASVIRSRSRSARQFPSGNMSTAGSAPGKTATRPCCCTSTTLHGRSMPSSDQCGSAGSPVTSTVQVPARPSRSSSCCAQAAASGTLRQTTPPSTESAALCCSSISAGVYTGCPSRDTAPCGTSPAGAA